MMIYDKAKYHYGSNTFPKDAEESAAFTHTGMFVGWIIDNDMLDGDRAFLTADAVRLYLDRKITGSDYYQNVLLGVLCEDDLNFRGNLFAYSYFDFSNGKYLKDYQAIFDIKDEDKIWFVEDSLDNYEKLRVKIDERYKEWLATAGDTSNAADDSSEALDEEMAKAIAQRTSLSLEESSKFLAAMQTIIAETLAKGDRVTINDLGTFEARLMGGYEIKSSVDGQEYRREHVKTPTINFALKIKKTVDEVGQPELSA